MNSIFVIECAASGKESFFKAFIHINLSAKSESDGNGDGDFWLVLFTCLIIK